MRRWMTISVSAFLGLITFVAFVVFQSEKITTLPASPSPACPMISGLFGSVLADQHAQLSESHREGEYWRASTCEVNGSSIDLQLDIVHIGQKPSLSAVQLADIEVNGVEHRADSKRCSIALGDYGIQEVWTESGETVVDVRVRAGTYVVYAKARSNPEQEQLDALIVAARASVVSALARL